MAMIFVYLTAATIDEAKMIGRTLVEEKLAACVNIFGGMTSIYHWQGELEESREMAMIAKTRAELFDALAARVKEIHSYVIPCIVEVPLGRIGDDYRDWLIRETLP